MASKIKRSRRSRKSRRGRHGDVRPGGLGERMIVCIDKKSSRTVSSWAEASDLIVSAWSARGARAFYSNPKAGIILDAAGQPVAHVSYNGAVWAGTARFGTGKEKLYPDQ